MKHVYSSHDVWMTDEDDDVISTSSLKDILQGNGDVLDKVDWNTPD